MPDLYLTIADQPPETIAAIAASMDDRMNDPAMRAICAHYMGALPKRADVLEIGCGNGASTAQILEVAVPARLHGIDPSEGLLDRARQRFDGDPRVSFSAGDVLQTGFDAASFDVIVAHTVYSHIPDPQGALAEAFRVLRPGGVLAIFDGDYATNTVALYDGDPLQAAMAATQRNVIHDLYIMRRLPGLMSIAGFEVGPSMAHGFVQTHQPDYMISLMARGVDASVRNGDFTQEVADAFKAEAHARAKAGSFYGAILFLSVTARKPG